jgi:hypothetical protein
MATPLLLNTNTASGCRSNADTCQHDLGDMQNIVDKGPGHPINQIVWTKNQQPILSWQQSSQPDALESPTDQKDLYGKDGMQITNFPKHQTNRNKANEARDICPLGRWHGRQVETYL